jgi:hypothetical protein
VDTSLVSILQAHGVIAALKKAMFMRPIDEGMHTLSENFAN